jgi:hypothetical protein
MVTVNAKLIQYFWLENGFPEIQLFDETKMKRNGMKHDHIKVLLV